jgi:hypothetical protein
MKDEVGGMRGTYGEGQKSIQEFGRETWRKETSRKA